MDRKLKSKTDFSMNRTHRLIEGVLSGIGTEERSKSEERIERILSEDGIPQSGIRWRRNHLAEIDMALEKLRWWLDDCRHHRYDDTDYNFKDAAENPVKCPICGRIDNGWPLRHGLCCDCWCREYNFRYSEKSK